MACMNHISHYLWDNLSGPYLAYEYSNPAFKFKSALSGLIIQVKE